MMLLTALFWICSRAVLLFMYSCSFGHLKVGPGILPACVSNPGIMYAAKSAADDHESALRCGDPPTVLSPSGPYAQDGKRSASIPYTTLHEVVKAVDRKAFDKILNIKKKEKLDRLINQQDGRGYTPLLWCLDIDVLSRLNFHQKQDYLYMLKRLLNHPSCDIFVCDDDNKNVLHWAVLNKYEKACQLIFERLRDEEDGEVKRFINQKDDLGYCPLHYLFLFDSEAYSEAHSAILQQFLDDDLCDINAKDADGFPLLYWLIRYNHPNLSKKVLESERLETFIQFIWKKVNEYYIYQPLDFVKFWKDCSSIVSNILRVCVNILAYSGPGDPNINMKKLLLKKYFCLGQYNELYTNQLVKQLFSEQSYLLWPLYKFAEQIYQY